MSLRTMIDDPRTLADLVRKTGTPCFVYAPWLAAGRMSELPRDGAVWAVCASGFRASIAASLLDAAGVPVKLVARGGVPDALARGLTAATKKTAR